MRILHTSDWHLGRIFHEIHLTQDQAYVLEQMICLAKDARPDVVVVSGDIYDRAVPPPDAVELLDHVLSELVLGLGAPVILIAGNHDSPDRLAFGSSIMKDRGLHIFGPLRAQTKPVIFEDESGPVYFCPVPYAEPAIVRDRLENQDIKDHNTALQALAENARAGLPPGARSVLITHAFVRGGTESESERPLSVGGTGMVDVSCFKGFHYVALGHLHRRQSAATEAVHYSGSILKYSFSEADHEKSVQLVEMDGRGRCRLEILRLEPRYEVRLIEGYLDELLSQPHQGGKLDDYVSARLLDRGALYDPMGRLRQVYPNVLEIKRPFLTAALDSQRPAIDHRKMKDLDLFASFYQQVTGEPLSAAEKEAFARIAEDLRQRDREAMS